MDTVTTRLNASDNKMIKQSYFVLGYLTALPLFGLQTSQEHSL